MTLDLFTPEPYGGHPGYQHTATSKEAARTTPAEVIRERVLALYREGNRLTADEAARMLGLDVLTVRPRVTELKKHDPPLLRATGETRPSRFGKACDVMEAV